MNRNTQLFILRICLAAIAIFNLAKYSYRVFTDETDDNPMDFRVFWTATKVQANGENFYDDANVKKMWHNVAVNEDLKTEVAPGFPVTGVTYPPWFSVIFKPFALFNWASARIIIIILNLVLVGFTIYLFKHIYPSVSLLIATLAIFAFKGTTLGLFTGNPLFISFFFIILSLFYYSKNKNILSGIFLGLASFKISLVFPFVIFFMFRWQWKILFTSLAVLLIQAAIIILPYNNPMQLIDGFLHNMTVLQELGVSGGLTYNVINNTELGTLIGQFFSVNSSILSYASLVIIFGVIGLLNHLKKFNDSLLLSLICTACLLFTHHFIYDGLILIFILPLFYQLPFRKASWLFILFIPLMLPITGLAFMLPHDGLKVLLMLHIPFVMMALMITLLIFAAGNNKTNAINT